MIVISDTSPLSYLIRIGHIEILPELYYRVFVPTTVCAELASQQAREAVRTWITTPPEWLEIRKTQQQPDADMMKARLDAGEQDAILLALELGAKELIIDDFDARREAQRLKLYFVGTLGVLRLAARIGLLDLRQALAKLQQTNFHVSQALIEKLLKDAEVEAMALPPKCPGS